MLSPITHGQFERIRERFPGATLDELPSGAALLTVPNVEIPRGWSAATTTIRFLVPPGYPGPAPDCFWSDTILSLAVGGMPQASQPAYAIPETGRSGQWFSWHVTDAAKNWHPNRDELMTFLKIALDRFRELK